MEGGDTAEEGRLEAKATGMMELKRRNSMLEADEAASGKKIKLASYDRVTSESWKKIQLKSSDEILMEVDEAVAVQSPTINNALECASGDKGIVVTVPIPNVTAEILEKVVEYCSKQVEWQKLREEGKVAVAILEANNWEAEFLTLDLITLCHLITAANYLEIKTLLHLTCGALARLFEGKTVEQMRTFFNIENDLTPEEEGAFRAKYCWAFE